MLTLELFGWQGQIDVTDGRGAYEDYGDDLIMKSCPVVSEGIWGDELKQFIWETLKQFCVRRRGLIGCIKDAKDKLFQTAGN